MKVVTTYLVANSRRIERRNYVDVDKAIARGRELAAQEGTQIVKVVADGLKVFTFRDGGRDDGTVYQENVNLIKEHFTDDSQVITLTELGLSSL